MKYFFNIVLLIVFGNCLSQTNYQEEPKSFSKMKFVYEQKSNYFINQNGVYADTVLLKFHFPKIRCAKVKSPINPNQTVGFIAYSSVQGTEDRRKLISSIYHDTQTYEGIFDVKSNKTVIKVKRNHNCEAYDRIRSYMGENELPDFQYRIEINYEKETIGSYFPDTRWSCSFKKEQNTIVFEEDKKSGYYKDASLNSVATNFVILNNNLNNKIVPGLLFTNNDFGVEGIKTLFSIYVLKSVTYE